MNAFMEGTWDMIFQPTRPLRGATAGQKNVSSASAISTHAPLAGRDSTPASWATSSTDFNPRAPCGARPIRPLPRRHRRNFNPRAPCGARRLRRDLDLRQPVFQPTRPLRGATGRELREPRRKRFQPTRPLRGATAVVLVHPRLIVISTHAPLAGRDGLSDGICRDDGEISTHAPLAGRDGIPPPRPHPGRDFNPRAPCGARPSLWVGISDPAEISTHAPLAGRDCWWTSASGITSLFQPTRPLRGATAIASGIVQQMQQISTHAPLAGRDDDIALHLTYRPGISTHAPLAGRDRAAEQTGGVRQIFQPTRPLRGATTPHPWTN